MGDNAKPFLGFLQPANGCSVKALFNAMKGKRKTPKIAGFMRVVLADNMRSLMQRRFKDSANLPMSLAKEAGVSLSTVQRILNQDVGASLDNIEAIAHALDLAVYQLLLPALNIDNPQVVQGAIKTEEVMYRRWQRSKVAPQPEKAEA